MGGGVGDGDGVGLVDGVGLGVVVGSGFPFNSLFGEFSDVIWDESHRSNKKHMIDDIFRFLISCTLGVQRLILFLHSVFTHDGIAV